jgi:hypothetical protein
MVNLHVLLTCLVAIRNYLSEVDQESTVHFKTLHGLEMVEDKHTKTM